MHSGSQRKIFRLWAALALHSLIVHSFVSVDLVTSLARCFLGHVVLAHEKDLHRDRGPRLGTQGKPHGSTRATRLIPEIRVRSEKLASRHGPVASFSALSCV